MKNVKPVVTLTNLLTKYSFAVKELVKDKSIVALRKGFPRLQIQALRKGYLIRNTKELHDRALMNNSGILNFINDLNKNTVISKYYLSNNSLTVEAMLLTTEGEKDFKVLLNILKHDMKQILINNKQTKKFIVV
jgi:hypothetical protein